MSVGYPKGKADVDERSGTLCVSLRNVFGEIAAFQAFLQSTPDSDLTKAPYNYELGEVAVLKSAFNDLAKLGQIYEGNEIQPEPYDFTTFAHLLTGVL